jgi:hypothetical protein
VDATFKDTENSLAQSLRSAAAALQKDTITLRELLELLGEQSLLLFCAVLCVPFMLPVSIPGVSTVFGLVIILIGVGVTLNRLPWLPGRLMKREILREHLLPALEQGAKTFDRLERWVKPRLKQLTTGAAINRFNGLVLTFAGVLLIFPLGLVPFSNTLPAACIVLLAIGMLQRDGYFIMAGYVALVITVIYFVGLALLLAAGGHAILS